MHKPVSSTLDAVLKLGFVISVALLVYGLFRPQPLPMLFSSFDLLAHAASFCAVTLLGIVVFSVRFRVALILFLFVFSLVAEPLQHWLQESRHYSIFDQLANLIGFIVGLSVSVFLNRIQTAKRLKRIINF